MVPDHPRPKCWTLGLCFPTEMLLVYVVLDAVCQAERLVYRLAKKQHLLDARCVFTIGL
jgi:hypothetical protein